MWLGSRGQFAFVELIGRGCRHLCPEYDTCMKEYHVEPSPTRLAFGLGHTHFVEATSGML